MPSIGAMKKLETNTSTINKNKLALRKETVKEIRALDMRHVAGGLRFPSGHSVCC